MLFQQVIVSSLIGVCLLLLIVRQVQLGRLDIAYCWLWLGVGFGMLLVMLRYDWLLILTDMVGAKTATTTLFLVGFLVVLLMCLQFSMVISSHRRQIKRLTQHIAMLEKRVGVGVGTEEREGGTR